MTKSGPKGREAQPRAAAQADGAEASMARTHLLGRGGDRPLNFFSARSPLSARRRMLVGSVATRSQKLHPVERPVSFKGYFAAVVLMPEERKIEAHIGARIRLRRRDLGMTQLELGEAADLPYRHVQHFEHGRRTLAASQLHRIALCLQVPIWYFFIGLEDDPLLEQLFRDRDLIREVFSGIEDPGLRAQVLETIRSIARYQEAETR